MLSPDDIQERDFLVSLRGFDRAEVRAFLAEVADHVQELQERLEAAEGRAVQAAEDLESQTAADADRTPDHQDRRTIFADIGRETQRILDAAQEAADGIARQARVDADRAMQSARQQSARLIAEGEQRREAAEAVVAGLEAARGALSGQLREIGATVERVIDELGAPPPPAATVREALSAGLDPAPAARSRPAEASAPADAEDPTARVDLADADEPEDADEPVDADQPADTDLPADTDEPVAERADEPVAERADWDELSSREEPGPAMPAVTDAGAPAAPVEVAEPDPETTAAEEDPDTARVDDADAVAEALLGVGAADDPSDPHGLRASALSPLHPQLVRAIKRGLQEVQNLMLDRLRRTSGEGEIASLLPGDEELAEIGAAADGLLAEGYGAGVDVASLIVERDLPEPDGRRELVAEFLVDASERVRSPIAATLRMARSSDEDVSAWFDRIGAVFAELRGTVAEELSATHLMRVYELGLVDAWAAGGITHRRWVLGREPRCPEARCRHNDRAGVIAMGTPYPSGHEVPPVHVGCTCTTIPISEPPS